MSHVLVTVRFGSGVGDEPVGVWTEAGFNAVEVDFSIRKHRIAMIRDAVQKRIRRINLRIWSNYLGLCLRVCYQIITVANDGVE